MQVQEGGGSYVQAGCCTGPRDELLDEDDGTLPGCAKDVNAAEKRIRHRLLPRNAWMLVPFFELFMSCPKDELHQWYVKLS